MNTNEGRYNTYAMVHKGLRAWFAHTLVELGSTDWHDAGQRTAVLAGLEDLLAMCESHIEHEDHFVHAAMEARMPGSSRRTADDHPHHATDIARLRDLAASTATDVCDARDAGGIALYRAFAAFVADNLLHMNVEETHNNRVLWACYSDDEIRAIEQRIVASVPPEESMRLLHWVLPAATPTERAAMLREMQAAMPPPVFDGVLEMLRMRLGVSAYQDTTQALAA